VSDAILFFALWPSHLVQSLQQALIPFGHEPDRRVYRLHITISRKARSFEEVRPARPAELTWTDFELAESVSFRGETGYHAVKQ